jgi:hypothetical protein
MWGNDDFYPTFPICIPVSVKIVANTAALGNLDPCVGPYLPGLAVNRH